MARITRILVPTDFSETSDAALRYARMLAETFGASLHLVHAFEDPYAAGALTPEVYGTIPQELRDSALRLATTNLEQRLPATDRSRGTTAVVMGAPAAAIVKYATENGIDLIVMDTHGRGGVAHLLLGSVAEKVVRTAACPVLSVREPAAAPSDSEKKGAIGNPAVIV
jgi:nucleotide-binding universal stress UspA family protein